MKTPFSVVFFVARHATREWVLMIFVNNGNATVNNANATEQIRMNSSSKSAQRNELTTITVVGFVSFIGFLGCVILGNLVESIALFAIATVMYCIFSVLLLSQSRIDRNKLSQNLNGSKKVLGLFLKQTMGVQAIVNCILAVVEFRLVYYSTQTNHDDAFKSLFVILLPVLMWIMNTYMIHTADKKPRGAMPLQIVAGVLVVVATVL